MSSSRSDSVTQFVCSFVRPFFTVFTMTTTFYPSVPCPSAPLSLCPSVPLSLCPSVPLSLCPPSPCAPCVPSCLSDLSDLSDFSNLSYLSDLSDPLTELAHLIAASRAEGGLVFYKINFIPLFEISKI